MLHMGHLPRNRDVRAPSGIPRKANLSAPSIGQLFEITLEPSSGSPTGRPTGPVLFKGNTALAQR
jgi:anti-sigma-K factor RskA